LHEQTGKPASLIIKIQKIYSCVVYFFQFYRQTLDTKPDPDGFQPKMVDPDPESMNLGSKTLRNIILMDTYTFSISVHPSNLFACLGPVFLELPTKEGSGVSGRQGAEGDG
jgi:hypothetical protein